MHTESRQHLKHILYTTESTLIFMTNDITIIMNNLLQALELHKFNTSSYHDRAYMYMYVCGTI